MIVIYGFLAAMCALMLAGGAIAVIVLGSFAVSGYGELDHALTSAARGAIAVALVAAWVLALVRIKDWIFYKKYGF